MKFKLNFKRNSLRVQMKGNYMTFGLLFVFLLLVNLSESQNQQNNLTPVLQQQKVLDQQLDPLKTTPYKQMYHKPINVSIGEELVIVLPSFDSAYNQQVIQFRQLSQNDYSNILQELQTKNVQEKDDFEGKQTEQNKTDKTDVGVLVAEDQLPLKCSYVKPQAKVYEVISKVGDQSGFSQINFQNKQYVHVSSRQLLYILNGQNMLLSVYYYNDLNIKFLNSFQLPVNKKTEEQQKNYGNSHTSVAMSLNSKETQLYIFSSMGIWVIQTKTFLTNIKHLKQLSGYDPAQTNGVDKVIRGTGAYFIAMKKMIKIVIVPQPFTNQRANATEITKFHQQRIFPQDITVHSSHLFVLDVYKGIYVYRILPTGNVKELFKISLDNYGGNYRIQTYQLNTLFVNFNDFDGSKVMEISIDVQTQKAQLVRYFKNQDFISYLQTYSVLTSSTGFYLNQVSAQQEIDINHIRNSAQTLLLMVSNFQQIHMFPFNIDPRTINSAYNGVKIYYPKVKQIHHIFGDRFLILTQDTIDYVKISIQKPEISCLLGNKYNQKSSKSIQNMQISVKSNISTCEYRNKLFRHKIFYNQNCELTTQYVIHLNDPEQSSLKKMITYGIVLLVVAAFILGLFCLMQWRNQKLVVLSRLKDQIIRFRNRHRRMQPFVEQQQPHKRQVQMQVPKDIEYIPNDQEEN